MKPLHLRARDFVLYRVRLLRGWLKHSLRRQLAVHQPKEGPFLLHVGSGAAPLDGWVNLDIQKIPEVDVALDVRAGLPFADVDKVFAEHFLEHLEIDAALDFLLEVHRILRPEGWLRLSTPNLDWVWRHLYADGRADGEPAIRAAMEANRAFYGWRHRFLWNRPLLERALVACGFRDLRWCRYGESEIEEFRGIERHEAYEDSAVLCHVLIVEAAKGAPDPEALGLLRAELGERFLRHKNV